MLSWLWWSRHVSSITALSDKTSFHLIIMNVWFLWGYIFMSLLLSSLRSRYLFCFVCLVLSCLVLSSSLIWDERSATYHIVASLLYSISIYYIVLRSISLQSVIHTIVLIEIILDLIVLYWFNLIWSNGYSLVFITMLFIS